MENVKIVFWSGTGNTAAMAQMLADGVSQAGASAELINVDGVNVDELLAQPGFALGCPSMGVEVLEESEMEPFVESIEGSVSGKTIALFGSYGWGDGEWMRNWVERMEAAGATVIGGEGVIANDAPDDDAKAELEEVAKQLASL